ncbi:hypothetical protein C0J52_02309 [Blattella germanica]|nr:hypothetical protein C0J52_02309 [Blattella germanica]
MNNKWSDVCNRSNTNIIKSELQVAMNFPYPCCELYEFAKNDIKLLRHNQLQNTCKFL